jgi:aerobic carbon-monoxide dehydrogenase small subunit
VVLDRPFQPVHIRFPTISIWTGDAARLIVQQTAGASSTVSRAEQGRMRRRNYHMANVTMTVNGKSVTAEIDPRTLLVQFVREHLRLTGTHVGCDTSQCGACVVHIDGKAVKACTILAVQCEGSDVLTIEGLATDGELHPMQAAFREHHGLQCGFCTPGMIMSAVDIVNRKGSNLDEATIRHELEGNICRCTGYHNIVRAVEAGAKAMTGGGVREAAE